MDFLGFSVQVQYVLPLLYQCCSLGAVEGCARLCIKHICFSPHSDFYRYGGRQSLEILCSLGTLSRGTLILSINLRYSSIWNGVHVLKCPDKIMQTEFTSVW